MRKRNKNTLPRLNTKQQKYMWNDVFLHSYKELMSQRQRRTAFAIKNRMGKDPVTLENRVRIEEYDNGVEIIFFSREFAKKIGAAKFNNSAGMPGEEWI